MKRKFAHLSACATPPVPAALVDSRASVAATAPQPDAKTPGRIDSDSLREENQTGSNPIKVSQNQSGRIKPQKIKNPPILCFLFPAKVGVASPWAVSLVPSHRRRASDLSFCIRLAPARSRRHGGTRVPTLSRGQTRVFARPILSLSSHLDRQHVPQLAFV